jgi:hypothetical protein
MPLRFRVSSIVGAAALTAGCALNDAPPDFRPLNPQPLPPVADPLPPQLNGEGLTAAEGSAAPRIVRDRCVEDADLVRAACTACGPGATWVAFSPDEACGAGVSRSAAYACDPSSLDDDGRRAVCPAAP